MNFELLKHPAVGAIISILIAVIVALPAAAGFGAFAPAEKNYTAQLVGIPAAAKPAETEQFEDFLTSQWLPEPSYRGTPIGFEKSYNEYVLTGKACNGFGVLLTPDLENGTYSTAPAGQTEMWCGQRAHEYEAAIGQAFERGDTFYVEDADTVYVGKNGKGLRLTRVDGAERGDLVAGVPASATKATPEEMDRILASRWTTDNAPKGTVITFDAGADGAFFVDGSACNGFGAALKVNRTKATYSVQDMPVTKMGCEPVLQNFDTAMNRALKHGDTFYIDGDNAFLAKKGTGLKLTPAR